MTPPLPPVPDPVKREPSREPAASARRGERAGAGRRAGGPKRGSGRRNSLGARAVPGPLATHGRPTPLDLLDLLAAKNFPQRDGWWRQTR